MIEFGENLVAGRGRIDAGECFCDMSLGIDDERMAGREFDDTKIGHRAVRIHHFVIGVGEQPEVEALLGAEVFVGIDGVAADSQDDGVALSVFRLVHLKLVGFAGSTRGLIFGIEIKNDPLAAVVFEADKGAVLGGESEVRGGGADRGC